MPKIASNSISLAGEFAVLSQLALRGYDANMTLGRTKGVDILVSNPATLQMFQLEVKTTLKKNERPAQAKLFGHIVSSWLMGAKHESTVAENLFYCFVNIAEDTHSFRFYIVPSDVVAKYVSRQHELWLQADRMHKNTMLRQFRIGSDQFQYKIETPSQEKYEDNWDFKR